MLATEQNELMCRIGPGTPMGNLIRQYWLPALPSYEFPSPDSPILSLTPENVEPPVFMMEEANWVQNLEGDTDTMHTEWIHARLTPEMNTPEPGQIPGMWGPHWKSAFVKPPSQIDPVATEY